MVVVVVRVAVDCAQKEDFKLWGGSVKGESCVQVIEVAEVVEEVVVLELAVTVQKKRDLPVDVARSLFGLVQLAAHR